MRIPFYEVDQDAYLFPSKVSKSETRANLEEPVRQWCAHELLRAYGIPVAQLEFEKKIRVGSTHPRIDILISRDGKPWALVECKEPKFNKHEDGVGQARSYANAHGVHAEFIIYTNGDVWRVQRRRGNEWVPVPDLPQWESMNSDETIVPVLKVVDLLKPLLLQLDQEVSGAAAIKFLADLQEFFNFSNLLTRNSEPSLIAALDNLLRGVFDPKQAVGYRCGKLRAAYVSFERFNKDTGIDLILPEVLTPTEVCSEIHALSVGVIQLLDSAKEVPGESENLLRLCSVLLNCGVRFEGSKTRELRIPSEVHGALRDYLNHVLILNLNVSLPDTIDAISVGDMRALCKPSKKFGRW